ncbi:hypothetical protein EG68_05203 [Paragonimus skrjabini miyazakii]|uniref:PDZ domain-containing protein n=1 Tax=Paragonimus skrjabini miyazakii TaxID=59628 RepID=A0A8S9YAL0_9TREM|nr:hypothetical protein EG68_05203 [Paragonimus skrjabini miyazakii]
MSKFNRAHNLEAGDQILSISGFPLDWRTIEQLRYGLLDSVEVQRLSANANLYELADHLLNEPYRTRRDSKVVLKKPTLIVARKPPSKTRVSLTKQDEGTNPLQPFYHETVLETNVQSKGLGLQLGVDKDETGIFILSIAPASQAASDGQLKTGDRIVEVNYQNVEQLPIREALKRIKSTCQKAQFVHFKVLRSLVTTEEYSQVELGRSPERTGEPEKADDESTIFGDDHTIQTLERSESTVTAEPMRTSYEMEKMDPLGDIANPKRLVDYWNSQLPSNQKILIAEYDTTESSCGLGISIEGTLEKTNSHSSTQPHHYIVEILPGSPAGVQTALLAGDELLQVNSNVVYGMSHLEVAKILHSINPHGYIVCARKLKRYLPSKERDGFKDSDSETQSDCDLTEAEPIRSTNHTTSNKLVDNVKQTDLSISSDVDEFSGVQNIIIPQSSGHDRNPSNENFPDLSDGTCLQFIKMRRRSEEEYHQSYTRVRIIWEEDQDADDSQEINLEAEQTDEQHAMIFTDCPPTPSRLPKPARLAPVGAVKRISVGDNLYSHDNELKQSIRDKWAISYNEDYKCFSMVVHKKAGEFLGEFSGMRAQWITMYNFFFLFCSMEGEA